MTRNGLTGLGAAAGLVVLAADQGSKWWVLHVLDLPSLGQVPLLPMLNLTMVWNPGVTFGLLRADSWWGSLLLAGVAIGVVIALGFWLRRAESRLAALSIGAIAGGAIGNVIDRVRYGAVVDFIHFYIPTAAGEWSWYVFNVADASIVCGVAALVIETQWPRRAVSAGKSTHRAG